jgi:hypothetical protein
MKLLYYSPDDLEIAEVSKQFANAGIACVVRHSRVCRGEPEAGCAELWIRRDKDAHKAMMLCVQLGVGFAKRNGGTGVIYNWGDISSQIEDEAEMHVEAEPEHECPRKRNGRTNGLRRAAG